MLEPHVPSMRPLQQVMEAEWDSVAAHIWVHTPLAGACEVVPLRTGHAESERTPTIGGTPMLQSTGENQQGPTSGWFGNTTPTCWGIPNASEPRGKTVMAQKMDELAI